MGSELSGFRQAALFGLVGYLALTGAPAAVVWLLSVEVPGVGWDAVESRLLALAFGLVLWLGADWRCRQRWGLRLELPAWRWLLVGERFLLLMALGLSVFLILSVHAVGNLVEGGVASFILGWELRAALAVGFGLLVLPFWFGPMDRVALVEAG